MLDFGYEVHETVLEGAMFGALENRKRMCAVAITRGIEFSFDLLEMPIQVERTVGEILDPIGEDDSSWSEMAYLKVKEVRDAADGKGFKRQEVLPTYSSPNQPPIPMQTRPRFQSHIVQHLEGSLWRP
jgi:DNA (cytosine-5)-methyltransferase 1